ncbi:MAG: ABC transporter permease, partial [Oscillospiraceae bacterium]|nr:ABC transporter permease [Oscillospiraceae bacterium]
MNKERKKSWISEVWRQLRKNKLAVIALIVIVCLFLVAIFANFIAPHPFDEQNSKHTNEGPSAQFPLGTDKLGRCELSRLIYGSRQSLAIGLVTVIVAAVIGVIIGSISGFYVGKVDNILMRILDIY